MGVAATAHAHWIQFAVRTAVAWERSALPARQQALRRKHRPRAGASVAAPADVPVAPTAPTPPPFVPRIVSSGRVQSPPRPSAAAPAAPRAPIAAVPPPSAVPDDKGATRYGSQELHV